MRKTRLGIGSFCYPYAMGIEGFFPKQRMDAFGLVDKAVSLAVPVVQIGDNYPLHLLPWETLLRLKAYAKERGITLEVGTRGIQRENMARYVAIAEALDSKLLRVVIDAKDFEPNFEEIVALLKGVLPALERANLVLGVENHDRFPSEVFSRIIDTVNSRYIGIVLDTVNSFACQENTRQVMDNLARHTVNFHVKDFQICRVAGNMGLEITGTVAGKGFLRIPDMLKDLQNNAKTDFSTILELWMQPEHDVESTVLEEDRWVSESIAYLQTVLDEKP